MGSRLEIVFEDRDILVVNKPAGIGTQAPRPFDSLESRVRAYLNSIAQEHSAYLGIPHRLDRCVSGVVVFAKRKKSAQRLSKQFERREVCKTYEAIVEGRVCSAEPRDGTWCDYVRKIPDEPRAEVVPPDTDGAKHAVLHYDIVHEYETCTHLRIRLETGRMHQIRVQCASRGFPVCGDVMYGSPRPFGPRVDHDRDRHIALHAKLLEVEHPRHRERQQFEAPFPSTWVELRLERR